MRTAAKVVLALLAVPVVFFTGLGVLSELKEVVVISTALPDGSTRTTRIWVVDTPEGPLVRGTDDKPWVIGARATPYVSVERGGETRPWIAVEKRDLDHRRRADELMLDKYGLAERGIRLLRDFDRSVVFVLEAPGR